MQIRAATAEDDAQQLTDLINKAFRLAGSFTTELNKIMGERVSLDEMQDALRNPDSQLKNPFLLALQGDNQIVGCVQCKKTEDPAVDLLALLAVDPEMKGSGLGKKICVFALDWMVQEWGSKECEIEVLEKRPDLIEWYETRLDFHVVKGPEGRRKFQWPEALKDKAIPTWFTILRRTIP